MNPCKLLSFPFPVHSVMRLTLFSVHLFPFYFFLFPISFFGPYIFPVSNLWIPQHFSRRYSHWTILLLRRVTIWTPMWQGLERTKTTTASESEVSSLCLTPTAWGTTHSSLWCRIYSKLFFLFFFNLSIRTCPCAPLGQPLDPLVAALPPGPGSLNFRPACFCTYHTNLLPACLSSDVLSFLSELVPLRSLPLFRPRFHCLFFTHHGFRAAPGLIWYLLDCFNSRRSHVDFPWALTEPFLDFRYSGSSALAMTPPDSCPGKPLFLIFRTPPKELPLTDEIVVL